MQIPVTKEERKAEFKEFAKELHLVPEDDLMGKTIGIDEFRKKYCGGKHAEWVRTFILDVFKPDWVVNPHKQRVKTIIFEYPAKKWMNEHYQEIDWNAKLSDLGK
ncbi:DUF771 domain-containing protein [Lactobacillus sp. ESL0731]|uniref:DUF771 domain-containing protein n=1 Tax=unclassified Lactobacillus TaxID=2620435 RepID=UPI0023F7FE56|nr:MULTISPECIES: DUF771 domain-containing protein [unclassified Lactobacillus]WEV51641.1 DUF771 domain-containing protein [Lactobacillus sp. ESL0700]WEV62770.1 DUF771 domain-containing protein [Lactobacillus sp. ESL0731]